MNPFEDDLMGPEEYKRARFAIARFAIFWPALIWYVTAMAQELCGRPDYFMVATSVGALCALWWAERRYQQALVREVKRILTQ